MVLGLRVKSVQHSAECINHEGLPWLGVHKYGCGKSQQQQWGAG